MYVSQQKTFSTGEISVSKFEKTLAVQLIQCFFKTQLVCPNLIAKATATRFTFL